MANIMDDIKKISKYNSDPFNGKNFKTFTPYTDHTFEEMIQFAKDHNCQIVIQTRPHNGRPGAWYIKAKTDNFEYSDLKSKIIQNSQAYSSRICYLIKY